MLALLAEQQPKKLSVVGSIPMHPERETSLIDLQGSHGFTGDLFNPLMRLEPETAPNGGNVQTFFLNRKVPLLPAWRSSYLTSLINWRSLVQTQQPALTVPNGRNLQTIVC